MLCDPILIGMDFNLRPISIISMTTSLTFCTTLCKELNVAGERAVLEFRVSKVIARWYRKTNFHSQSPA